MPPIIKFKASLHTLTILQIYRPDLISISLELELMTKKTPRFFNQLPVIVDLQFLSIPKFKDSFNLEGLTACLRKQGLVPIGIRGGTTADQNLAKEAGWALFSEVKTLEANIPEERLGAKIVTDPVRSGQQIYAEGDLIILGSVSPGAELLAEGHIHIYGRLSGRAFAGISDKKTAYIFCSQLEAELVAIAGYYWLYEDLQKNIVKDYVCLYLKNEQLHIRYQLLNEVV